MGILNNFCGEWSRDLIGELELIAAVIFWGISYVLQRYAMLNEIKPFTFNACRFFLSTVFLYSSKNFMQNNLETKFDETVLTESGRNRSPSYVKQYSILSQPGFNSLIFWGVVIGLANCLGAVFQQVGLVTVTAGKTGFITSMYVVVIPVVEWFIPSMGNTLNFRSWCAVLMSLVGVYLVSGCAEAEVCFGGAVQMGELLVFLGMLCWVVSIMVSEVAAKKFDTITLTCYQFLICAIVSLVIAPFIEPDEWLWPLHGLRKNWFIIILVGFTEAAGTLFATIGLIYCSSTKAGILLSLEALSAAIFGFVILAETLTMIEMIGCLIMILAAILSSTAVVTEQSEEGIDIDSIPQLELGERTPMIRQYSKGSTPVGRGLAKQKYNSV